MAVEIPIAVGNITGFYIQTIANNTEDEIPNPPIKVPQKPNLKGEFSVLTNSFPFIISLTYLGQVLYKPNILTIAKPNPPKADPIGLANGNPIPIATYDVAKAPKTPNPEVL